MVPQTEMRKKKGGGGRRGRQETVGYNGEGQVYMTERQRHTGPEMAWWTHSSKVAGIAEGRGGGQAVAWRRIQVKAT